MAKRPSEPKRTDGYRSVKAAREAQARHRDSERLRKIMAAAKAAEEKGKGA